MDREKSSGQTKEDLYLQIISLLVVLAKVLAILFDAMRSHLSPLSLEKGDLLIFKF